MCSCCCYVGLLGGFADLHAQMAYPESPSLPSSREDVMKRAKERIPRWLKDGTDFRCIRAEPYVLHQRVARQGRKGRVLLAGDALHVSLQIL